MSLVEEQAEVGENNPEFLPAVTVLELPQEVTGELVLHRGRQQRMFQVRQSDLHEKVRIFGCESVRVVTFF